jgi:hypothetical protein
MMKSVKKLELRAMQVDENDVISSSDVECRLQKKSRTVTHGHLQYIADIGKSRAEAKMVAAIRKMEAENRKLELQLKLSKHKHDKNETDRDDE